MESLHWSFINNISKEIWALIPKNIKGSYDKLKNVMFNIKDYLLLFYKKWIKKDYYS